MTRVLSCVPCTLLSPQFVNFTDVMARSGPDAGSREAQFALRALMEVPQQYKVGCERQLHHRGAMIALHAPLNQEW
jgi:hypothetical protein